MNSLVYIANGIGEFSDLVYADGEDTPANRLVEVHSLCDDISREVVRNGGGHDEVATALRCVFSDMGKPS